jgi:ubiquinone biosynthesis protein Coq4
LLNTTGIISGVKAFYQIVASEFKSEDCAGTQVYGLMAIYYGNTCEIVEISDISCKKEDVALLIDKLVSEDVEPGQLIYIVEDFLAELYSARN